MLEAERHVLYTLLVRLEQLWAEIRCVTPQYAVSHLGR